MGNLGSGATRPLVSRQHARILTQLTPELRPCLTRRYTAVATLPPRITPPKRGISSGARTDAQASGHFAVVSGRPNTQTIQMRMPEWSCESSSGDTAEPPVALVEIRDVPTECSSASNVTSKSPLMPFARDNRAAVTALASGASGSRLAAVPVSLFWRVAVRGKAHWWLEYMHTDANAAGMPSCLRAGAIVGAAPPAA